MANKNPNFFTRLDIIRQDIESCCAAGTMSKFDVMKRQKGLAAAYMWSDIIMQNSKSNVIDQYYYNPLKQFIIGRTTDGFGKHTVVYTDSLSSITAGLSALDLIDETLFHDETVIASGPEVSVKLECASKISIQCINQSLGFQESRVRILGIVLFIIQSDCFKLDRDTADRLAYQIGEATPAWVAETKFFDPTGKSAESANDSWYPILPGTRTGEHSAIRADGSISPLTACYIGYSVN